VSIIVVDQQNCGCLMNPGTYFSAVWGLSIWM